MSKTTYVLSTEARPSPAFARAVPPPLARSLSDHPKEDGLPELSTVGSWLLWAHGALGTWTYGLRSPSSLQLEKRQWASPSSALRQQLLLSSAASVGNELCPPTPFRVSGQNKGIKEEPKASPLLRQHQTTVSKYIRFGFYCRAHISGQSAAHTTTNHFWEKSCKKKNKKKLQLL